MTPDEAALGFPKSTLATHTEARITRELHLQAVPSDRLVIEGEYPSCNSCKGKMNSFKGTTGADVEYKWPAAKGLSVENGMPKPKVLKNYLCGVVVNTEKNDEKVFRLRDKML